MRLFVSEFICGGGWKEGVRPPSLIREGAAMLRAVIEDLLLIPGMHVTTTWDRRLSIGPGLKTSSCFDMISVAGPDEERDRFHQLCHAADATYIIAPELNDELSDRVSVALSADTERSLREYRPQRRQLNSSIEAIDLCGDKWELFQHLIHHAIPTIPTVRLVDNSAHNPLNWPRVLKLRLGAGSQAMQLVSSPDEWTTVIAGYDNTRRHCEAIVQPYIPGRSLSVGAIIDRAGTVHRLPVADQLIDPQRGFTYLGGRIPTNRWAGSIDRLVDDVLATVPGLFGYVGIDLLIPDAAPETPLVVEINPRLTTSYVGYRQLCRGNLAELWLGDVNPVESLRWRDGHVEFNSAGELA